MKLKYKPAKALGLYIFLLGAGTFSTAHASLCGTLDTTNVTFNSIISTSCGGSYSGNNSNININTFNSGELKFGGSNWSDEIKDDNPGISAMGANFFSGINWTLSTSSGTTN